MAVGRKWVNTSKVLRAMPGRQGVSDRLLDPQCRPQAELKAFKSLHSASTLLGSSPAAQLRTTHQGSSFLCPAHLHFKPTWPVGLGLLWV